MAVFIPFSGAGCTFSLLFSPTLISDRQCKGNRLASLPEPLGCFNDIFAHKRPCTKPQPADSRPSDFIVISKLILLWLNTLIRPQKLLFYVDYHQTVCWHAVCIMCALTVGPEWLLAVSPCIGPDLCSPQYNLNTLFCWHIHTLLKTCPHLHPMCNLSSS